MLRFPRWKVVLTLAIVVLGAVLAAPNLISRQQADALPAWIPHRQISLGLDLQGGSHLLLQVETGAVLRERLENLVDAVRTELRKARIRYSGLAIEGPAVVVTVEDAARIAEAEAAVKGLDPDVTLAVGREGRLSLTLTDSAIRERQSAAVAQSIEIVRRRIDETGVREPTVQRQGSDRVLVQLPGIDDPERVKRLIGKTAKMTFHLVDDETNPADAMAGRVPPGSVLLPLTDTSITQGRSQMIVVRKRVVVSGENLIDAQPTFQQGQPVVSFRFDAVGGKRFGDATAQNVGRSLAIVLDDRVISAPRIREPILGGSGVITGSFSVQEAQDLALLLRAGALPAPLTVIEERSVGPGLGSDSIAAGKIACLVAVIAVAISMVVIYGFFGIMANVALLANFVLLVAAMSVLQATLTLPGIAGIALTLGMAVDANVLIYEHIREEVRNGRTPVSAIDSGFTRAFVTIFDSNITTLFAAVLLFALGSGPVRGFGVTLSIGILTSMFTAITLTRLMVIAWLRRTKPKLLQI
jgi:preprotein translocase subunit SecD